MIGRREVVALGVACGLVLVSCGETPPASPRVPAAYELQAVVLTQADVGFSENPDTVAAGEWQEQDLMTSIACPRDSGDASMLGGLPLAYTELDRDAWDFIDEYLSAHPVKDSTRTFRHAASVLDGCVGSTPQAHHALVRLDRVAAPSIGDEVRAYRTTVTGVEDPPPSRDVVYARFGPVLMVLGLEGTFEGTVGRDAVIRAAGRKIERFLAGRGPAVSAPTSTSTIPATANWKGGRVSHYSGPSAAKLETAASVVLPPPRWVAWPGPAALPAAAHPPRRWAAPLPTDYAAFDATAGFAAYATEDTVVVLDNRGNQLWSGRDAGIDDIVFSDDGRLFLGMEGDGVVRVRAVEARTGRPLWIAEYDVDAMVQGIGFSAGVVVLDAFPNDFGDRSAEFWVLDARTGAPRWKTEGEFVGAGADVAVVHADDRIIGVDVATGRGLWRLTSQLGFDTVAFTDCSDAVAFTDDAAFLALRDAEGDHIAAVNARSGQVGWSFDVAATPSRPYGGMGIAVRDSTVYVSDFRHSSDEEVESATLAAFAIDTGGNLRWSAAIPEVDGPHVGDVGYVAVAGDEFAIPFEDRVVFFRRGDGNVAHLMEAGDIYDVTDLEGAPDPSGIIVTESGTYWFGDTELSLIRDFS